MVCLFVVVFSTGCDLILNRKKLSSVVVLTSISKNVQVSNIYKGTY